MISVKHLVPPRQVQWLCGEVTERVALGPPLYRTKGPLEGKR